jgi:hypothetical protein
MFWVTEPRFDSELNGYKTFSTFSTDLRRKIQFRDLSVRGSFQNLSKTKKKEKTFFYINALAYCPIHPVVIQLWVKNHPAYLLYSQENNKENSDAIVSSQILLLFLMLYGWCR